MRQKQKSIWSYHLWDWRLQKYLKEKFGTPYVIGTPVGDFTEDLVMVLEQVTKNTDKKNKSSEEESTPDGQDKPEIPYLQNRLSEPQEITLIGEAVTMGSLAAAIEKKYHKSSPSDCVRWRQMQDFSL